METRAKHQMEPLMESKVKEIKNKWFSELNLPQTFKDKSFDNFDKELHPAAYEYLINYKSINSVVIFSPGIYGLGKTHLVCALINKLLDESEAIIIGEPYNREIPQPCPAQFVTEQQLLSRIRQSYNPRYSDSETENEVYDYFSKFPLLIIDDVGKVQPRDLSFLQLVYFNIIDDRYTNRKHIILTTNLSLNNLESYIGGACADRLREMCGKEGFIKMTGKSYRKGRYHD